MLLSQYSGLAETELQRIFSNAVSHAPSIILLDDADLFLKNRASDATEHQKRLVSCMLNLLDGVDVDSSRHVLFIATTARPNNLDPAIRRAGRIDKEIELTVPTPSDRYEILRLMLEELNLNIVLDEERGDAGEDIQRHVDESGQLEKEESVERDDEIVTSRLQGLMSNSAHGMVASDLLQACKAAAILSVFSLEAGTAEIHLNFEKLSIKDISLSASTSSFDSSLPDLSTSALKRHGYDASITRVSVSALQKALLSVTPSAIRDIAVENPNVRWKDIGGMETLKASLKEVLTHNQLSSRSFTPTPLTSIHRTIKTDRLLNGPYNFRRYSRR